MESQRNHPSSGATISSTADSECITIQSIFLRPFHRLPNSSGEPTCIERNDVQFGQIGHFEQIFPEGNMLDTDRAAHLTEKLLDIIMPELNREPRTQDNVWCVIDAIACVVAGLTKEPVALRYYVRALDNYSRDLT